MCIAQRSSIPLFPWSSTLSAKVSHSGGSPVLGSIPDSFMRKWIVPWPAYAEQPIVHRVRDIPPFHTSLHNLQWINTHHVQSKYYLNSILQHQTFSLTAHQLVSNSSLEKGCFLCLFSIFFFLSASHSVLFRYWYIKGFSLTLQNLLSQTNDKEVM